MQYKHAYFMGVIFAVHESTVKIGPLEKYPLYGSVLQLASVFFLVYTQGFAPPLPHHTL